MLVMIGGRFNFLVQLPLPSLLSHHLADCCSHIERVRKMALVLAEEEGNAVSLTRASNM